MSDHPPSNIWPSLSAETPRFITRDTLISAIMNDIAEDGVKYGYCPK